MVHVYVRRARLLLPWPSCVNRRHQKRTCQPTFRSLVPMRRPSSATQGSIGRRASQKKRIRPCHCPNPRRKTRTYDVRCGVTNLGQVSPSSGAGTSDGLTPHRHHLGMGSPLNSSRPGSPSPMPIRRPATFPLHLDGVSVSRGQPLTRRRSSV